MKKHKCAIRYLRGDGILNVARIVCRKKQCKKKYGSIIKGKPSNPSLYTTTQWLVDDKENPIPTYEPFKILTGLIK